MTIDIHSHLFARELYHESFWDWNARIVAGSGSGTTQEEATAEFKNSVLPKWWDLDGEGL